ncbi:MAG: hypothetical protein AAB557_04665 [Patescibacteria group bacterium]
MQLIRTTFRLRPDLKKAVERKALEEDTTFQAIAHRALEDYLAKAAMRKAQRLVFHTHDLGVPLDNLTRDDYYPEPAVHAD